MSNINSKQFNTKTFDQLYPDYNKFKTHVSQICIDTFQKGNPLLDENKMFFPWSKIYKILSMAYGHVYSGYEDSITHKKLQIALLDIVPQLQLHSLRLGAKFIEELTPDGIYSSEVTNQNVAGDITTITKETGEPGLTEDTIENQATSTTFNKEKNTRINKNVAKDILRAFNEAGFDDVKVGVSTFVNSIKLQEIFFNEAPKTIDKYFLDLLPSEELELATKFAQITYTRDEITQLLNSKANVGASYTKAEANAKLNGKANVGTSYTKTEADAKLNTKANVGASYTKAEADAKLNTKANVGTSYTKNETYNKQEIDNKVPSATPDLSNYQTTAKAAEQNQKIAANKEGIEKLTNSIEHFVITFKEAIAITSSRWNPKTISARLAENVVWVATSGKYEGLEKAQYALNEFLIDTALSNAAKGSFQIQTANLKSTPEKELFKIFNTEKTIYGNKVQDTDHFEFELVHIPLDKQYRWDTNGFPQGDRNFVLFVQHNGKNQDGSTTEKSKKVLVSFTTSKNATDKNALIKNAKWIDITNEEPGELLKLIKSNALAVATREKVIDDKKGWIKPDKYYNFSNIGIDNDQMSANYGNDNKNGIYGVLNNIIANLKKPGIWDKVKHKTKLGVSAYIVEGKYGGDNFIFNTAIKNSTDFNNKLKHRAVDNAEVKIAFLNDAGDKARVYVIEKLADGSWDNKTLWKQTLDGTWANSWSKVGSDLFVNSEADYQLDASLTNIKTPTGIKKLNDAFASGGLSCEYVNDYVISPGGSYVSNFRVKPNWFDNNKLTLIEAEVNGFSLKPTTGLFKFTLPTSNKSVSKNSLFVPFGTQYLELAKINSNLYKITDHDKRLNWIGSVVAYRIYQCN